MSDERKETHTPGPWSVGDTGDIGDGIWVRPSDLDANVICDLVGRLFVNEAEQAQYSDADIAEYMQKNEGLHGGGVNLEEMKLAQLKKVAEGLEVK